MIRRVAESGYLTRVYAPVATPYEKIISNPYKRLNVKPVVLIIFLLSSHIYVHSHIDRGTSTSCKYINVSATHRCMSAAHGVVRA